MAARILRRRVGGPKNKKQTRMALAPRQWLPSRPGKTSALDVAAVLEIVRVAVPAVALVMLIGVLAPKLSVGAS